MSGGLSWHLTAGGGALRAGRAEPTVMGAKPTGMKSSFSAIKAIKETNQKIKKSKKSKNNKEHRKSKRYAHWPGSNNRNRKQR